MTPTEINELLETAKRAGILSDTSENELYVINTNKTNYINSF